VLVASHGIYFKIVCSSIVRNLMCLHNLAVINKEVALSFLHSHMLSYSIKLNLKLLNTLNVELPASSSDIPNF